MSTDSLAHPDTLKILDALRRSEEEIKQLREDLNNLQKTLFVLQVFLLLAMCAVIFA